MSENPTKALQDLYQSLSFDHGNMAFESDADALGTHVLNLIQILRDTFVAQKTVAPVGPVAPKFVKCGHAWINVQSVYAVWFYMSAESGLYECLVKLSDDGENYNFELDECKELLVALGIQFDEKETTNE